MMTKDTDIGLEKKINQYRESIEKYNTNPWYTRIELFAAVSIVTLQFLTLLNLLSTHTSIHILYFFMTLVTSYILSDFINGLTHMIVDNNTNYTCLTGPFVAAFHLHHVRLRYQKKNIAKVYFDESGHKLWLFFYLVILFIAQFLVAMNFYMNLLFVAIGIFSSLAELSHYWCHNRQETHKIILFLQKIRILLSMKHHRHHHTHDNTHYAFLNGITDPIINRIAKRLYGGYKESSDKHVLAYHREISN